MKINSKKIIDLQGENVSVDTIRKQKSPVPLWWMLQDGYGGQWEKEEERKEEEGEADVALPPLPGGKRKFMRRYLTRKRKKKRIQNQKNKNNRQGPLARKTSANKWWANVAPWSERNSWNYQEQGLRATGAGRAQGIHGKEKQNHCINEGCTGNSTKESCSW